SPDASGRAVDHPGRPLVGARMRRSSCLRRVPMQPDDGVRARARAKETEMTTGKMIRAGALLAGLMTMTSGGAAHAGLMLKGGTTHFTSGLDKVSSAGPTWGLGYSFKPASFIAVETGTEGSRNEINDPASPDTSALLRLGETTMVKFILPVLPVVHPFVGVGIGLDYIMVQGGQSQFSMPIPIPGMPEQPES